MSYRGSSITHKIRHLKTNSGNNFSITISKSTAETFSGCRLREVVLSDGIFLTAGSFSIIEEQLINKKNLKQLKK